MAAIWTVLGVLYVMTGVWLMLKMDNSRRFYALLDRFSVPQQFACAITWPIALPLIIWGYRRG
ncbi:MAG: hypothetical protein SGI99_11445 [Pseudomonadota bacterium]|nr:hypothetical protein [Pseudomonadota bacterium]